MSELHLPSMAQVTRYVHRSLLNHDELKGMHYAHVHQLVRLTYAGIEAYTLRPVRIDDEPPHALVDLDVESAAVVHLGEARRVP